MKKTNDDKILYYRTRQIATSTGQLGIVGQKVKKKWQKKYEGPAIDEALEAETNLSVFREVTHH